MATSIYLNLGDQNLLTQYLSLASSALLEQSYGNLLLIQQSFPNDETDIDLAVKMSAYQRQMSSQARYYNQESMPGIITLMTFGSNFYALVNAFNTLLAAKEDDDILSQLKQLGQQLESLSDQAEIYAVTAQSLISRLQVAWNSLSPLMNRYQLVLRDIEDELSQDAKALAETISTLNALIAKNIQDVVDEGNKAGDGVKLLGKGIIAAFQVDDKKEKTEEKKDQKDSTATNKQSAQKSDSEQKDASKTSTSDTKKTDQSVQYMITGITTISSGIAGSSQAAKDLISNTEKVSKAYQALAKTNSVLAVAKSIDAQNTLFVESYNTVLVTAKKTPDNWKAISTAYQVAVNSINSLKNEDDISTFKRALALDTLQWKLLSNQIDLIKSVYAGNGSLPDAF